MRNKKFSLSIINDEISPNIDQCLKFIKKNQINLIDLRSINQINILDMKRKELGKINKILIKNDITVNMLVSPLFKWYPKTKNRGGIKKYDLHHFKPDLTYSEKKRFIYKSIDVLNIFNSNKIRIFSLIRSENNNFNFYNLEKDLYDLFISLCEKNNIQIYLENENSCNISDKNSILESIAKIKKLGMNYLFDIGSLYSINENLNFRTVVDIIKFSEYIHLKDYSYKKKEHVPIGEGDIPYKKIFTKLYKQVINIPMSLEVHTPKDPKSNQKSLNNMNKIFLKIER